MTLHKFFKFIRTDFLSCSSNSTCDRCLFDIDMHVKEVQQFIDKNITLNMFIPNKNVNEDVIKYFHITDIVSRLRTLHFKVSNVSEFI